MLAALLGILLGDMVVMEFALWLWGFGVLGGGERGLIWLLRI